MPKFTSNLLSEKKITNNLNSNFILSFFYVRVSGDKFFKKILYVFFFLEKKMVKPGYVKYNFLCIINFLSIVQFYATVKQFIRFTTFYVR